MQNIDLKKILKTANVKASFVGPHLFPGHKDPGGAVRRVMRGESLLNSEQVAKLSELLNVPIGMLFEDASWYMSAPPGRKHVVNFRAYNYFAELDTKTMKTTLSKNGLLFFEKVITHERGIGLTDYLSQLTDLVIKHK